MSPRRPLLDIELQSPREVYSPSADDPELPSKQWYHHLPLVGTVLLLLAPQPSLLYVLVNYHLRTLGQPITFTIHLLAICTLTFLSFSSLIVIVARDPGPVELKETTRMGGEEEDGEMGMTEALMADFDFSVPGMWCRKCWAPKPERAHHCSFCGRCVLKMDHHCPWMGNKCIGHRTYPAFIHFLISVTLLSIYSAVMCGFAVMYAFEHPLAIDSITPIHELLLSFAGIIFMLVIGSFLSYHLYLITINQTTLENVSPFLLLRHLPPLPRDGHSLSDPPLEPELSYPQRRLVKDAHSSIRLYDVGWKKNWAQVFGWSRPYGWLCRLFIGGSSPGDGRTFPRNPRSEEMLSRLAVELVKADKNR